jgi:hypothetical protein
MTVSIANLQYNMRRAPEPHVFESNCKLHTSAKAISNLNEALINSDIHGRSHEEQIRPRRVEA